MCRVLLKFGANNEAIDDLGRRPIECIPDAADFELVPDAQVRKVVSALQQKLSKDIFCLQHWLDESESYFKYLIKHKIILYIVAGNKIKKIKTCWLKFVKKSF